MHATEIEALDWAKHRFAELPVAGLLCAQPIRCDPRHGRITVSFQARRDFCNLIGSVQGGMLTAMLDLAMSFAVLCSLEGRSRRTVARDQDELHHAGTPRRAPRRRHHDPAWTQHRLHGRPSYRRRRQSSEHSERDRPDSSARRAQVRVMSVW
jgi:hypothetical protein